MQLSAAAPWLAFYGNTPASLQYPDTTMYGQLRATARQHPGLTAYSFMGKETAYDAFLQKIIIAAKGLAALGIRRGDRVTICMPNCPQALHCLYALNRLGAVANMIHPLSAETEIAFFLNASKSSAILTLDQFYPTVAAAMTAVKQECTILISKIQDELPLSMRLLYPMSKTARDTEKLPKEGYLLWTELLRTGAALEHLPEDEGQAQDCAVIMYSGGTTGTPKGIMLSNRNLNALALQTLAFSGYEDPVGMKMLSVLPLFHGFGLGIGIHTALLGGISCILVPKFSVQAYADLLKKEQPNLIPGVPTLFEALLQVNSLERLDLQFLKGIFCGGDSLGPELKEKVDAFLQDHGCTQQIREGYGATECVTASCLTPITGGRPGSIGIPFPDTFYKIVTPGTTEEVPAGTEGEICISGPTVMLGYLDNEAETQAALRHHEDGKVWFHTGDLGHMDEDGFVYFHQRIQRMILSSGYNIYPSQLENILNGHEKVRISCVIGVPDHYRGQNVRAYVVPAPGAEPTEALRAELLHYCGRHVAKYALPREIIFRQELPRTLVGKVSYRLLEEEAAREDKA